MANFFSNLYDQAPFRGGTAVFIPRSPNPDHKAGDVATYLTFNIPTGTVLTTGDIIHLLPATPAGFKLTRWAFLGPGYDGGAALTANLGYLSQALGVGVVTGLTVAGLRTGGAGNVISVTDAQLLAQTASSGPVTATTNLLAAGANDELVIFVSASAASAGTNGVSTILLEGVVP